MAIYSSFRSGSFRAGQGPRARGRKSQAAQRTAAYPSPNPGAADQGSV